MGHERGRKDGGGRLLEMAPESQPDVISSERSDEKSYATIDDHDITNLEIMITHNDTTKNMSSQNCPGNIRSM